MEIDDNWRAWNKNTQYGDVLYKRAIGEFVEMESAKAICDIINKIYKPGMSILDVGCGAGHYLRSLMNRVDPNINYTGFDATPYYIELAKKAFPNHSFKIGDIFDISYENNSFDIVICNNVLLHLPPDPSIAINELVRVSKSEVIIRALFSERNYVIKEIHNNGTFEEYNYFNMYTEEYYIGTLKNQDVRISIEKDLSFREFNNKSETNNPTATHVLNGTQVSGNLMLDWRFIKIQKNTK
jgi:ubiquinone/menaquinone biosynthesis C-methylase UbiE